MFSKHCKLYEFPPYKYVIVVEEYAVLMGKLDICAGVSKNSDRYPI